MCNILFSDDIEDSIMLSDAIVETVDPYGKLLNESIYIGIDPIMKNSFDSWVHIKTNVLTTDTIAGTIVPMFNTNKLFFIAKTLTPGYFSSSQLAILGKMLTTDYLSTLPKTSLVSSFSKIFSDAPSEYGDTIFIHGIYTDSLCETIEDIFKSWDGDILLYKDQLV